MDVRNSSNVPRETGSGACEETEPVIDKVGDDHFNDLQWKPICGRRAFRGRPWGSGTETESPDHSYGSVPNSHSEQPDNCGQNVAEHKAVEIRITWDFGCRGPHGCWR